MKRRDFLVLLGGTTAASVSWPLGTGAQTRTIPRIGYLASSGPAMTGRMLAALRQGLTELGYVDGQTISVELRQAEA
jgi:putative tryptophan/tyrosine transport system substrate-binding protein